MTRILFVATALLSAALASARGDTPASLAGSWRLTNVVSGAFEQTPAIVKLKADGDKLSGEIVATLPGITSASLKSVTLQGGLLRITVQTAAAELSFEAAVPKSPGKKVLGTMS